VQQSETIVKHSWRHVARLSRTLKVALSLAEPDVLVSHKWIVQEQLKLPAVWNRAITQVSVVS